MLGVVCGKFLKGRVVVNVISGFFSGYRWKKYLICLMCLVGISVEVGWEGDVLRFCVLERGKDL